MRNERLSDFYYSVASLLDAGYRGTYGDLAEKAGRSTNWGRSAGRCVKAYKARHPDWDDSRVYPTKR